jgi:uncharacterized protein involved in exopolysaccharide biosynthesis
VKHPLPDRAAFIADEIAKVFADRTRRTRQEQLKLTDEELRNQIGAVQASINEREQQLETLSTPATTAVQAERQRRIVELRSEVESLRSNLTVIQTLQQQVRLDEVRNANSVSLAVPARIPESPVEPKTLLNTVLGVMFGSLVAGILFALALGYTKKDEAVI